MTAYFLESSALAKRFEPVRAPQPRLQKTIPVRLRTAALGSAFSTRRRLSITAQGRDVPRRRARHRRLGILLHDPPPPRAIETVEGVRRDRLEPEAPTYAQPGNVDLSLPAGSGQADGGIDEQRLTSTGQQTPGVERIEV